MCWLNGRVLCVVGIVIAVVELKPNFPALKYRVAVIDTTDLDLVCSLVLK